MAQTEAQARHYQANKEDYYRASRKSRAAREQKVIDLKSSTPCFDCGVTYPAPVMHYHHRDPEHKTATISHLVRSSGIQRVLDEIAKCDLLCANCHALRHVDAGDYSSRYRG